MIFINRTIDFTNVIQRPSGYFQLIIPVLASETVGYCIVLLHILRCIRSEDFTDPLTENRLSDSHLKPAKYGKVVKSSE